MKRRLPLPYLKSDDHDQRFKLLVREFIGSFFQMFWPDFVKLCDFSQVEWLEQEAFPDPPRGKRKSLDMVGRLRLLEPVELRSGKLADSLMAVVHIEIESRSSVDRLKPQMFRYFSWLRQKYDVPVLPAAIYLNVAADGIGVDTYEEQFGNLLVVQYNYLYVGLPGLEAAKFLNSGVPLGAALSALMRLPDEQRVRHRAFALKRVVESGENDYRQYLLAECIQNYIPLTTSEEHEEFEMITRDKQFEEVKKKSNSWFGQGYEKGIEQGIEQGIVQGQLDLAVRLLQNRFGSVPKKVREELASLTAEELTAVLERSQTVHKLRDALRRTS